MFPSEGDFQAFARAQDFRSVAILAPVTVQNRVQMSVFPPRAVVLQSDTLRFGLGGQTQRVVDAVVAEVRPILVWQEEGIAHQQVDSVTEITCSLQDEPPRLGFVIYLDRHFLGEERFAIHVGIAHVRHGVTIRLQPKSTRYHRVIQLPARNPGVADVEGIVVVVLDEFDAIGGLVQ